MRNTTSLPVSNIACMTELKQNTRYLTEYKARRYVGGTSLHSIGSFVDYIILVEVLILELLDSHIKLQTDNKDSYWLTREEFEEKYKIIQEL